MRSTVWASASDSNLRLGLDDLVTRPGEVILRRLHLAPIVDRLLQANCCPFRTTAMGRKQPFVSDRFGTIGSIALLAIRNLLSLLSLPLWLASYGSRTPAHEGLAKSLSGSDVRPFCDWYGNPWSRYRHCVRRQQPRRTTRLLRSRGKEFSSGYSMLSVVMANCLAEHMARSILITIVIAAKPMKGMTAMGR